MRISINHYYIDIKKINMSYQRFSDIVVKLLENTDLILYCRRRKGERIVWLNRL
jgi:hypothetical protein